MFTSDFWEDRTCHFDLSLVSLIIREWNPSWMGTVRAQNIDLEFVVNRPPELFYRNLKYDEFDVSEMSISDTLIAVENRRGGRWDWSALPVFLSKAFLWFDFYVNNLSGVEHLGELKGKRVGVPDYTMTAALWMRAILKELYNLNPADIVWYNGRTKVLSHGGVLGLDKNPPPGISLNWLREDQTLDVMLDRGELDAVAGLRPQSPLNSEYIRMDRYGSTPLFENSRIRKFFHDGGKEVTLQFFQRTGVIPSSHMIIIQNRIIKEYPWVPLELYRVFKRSKEISYERAEQYRSPYLLFKGNEHSKQAATFGEDPYPLGLKANRKMLERVFAASLEQGLTRKESRIEEIFCTTTLDT